MRISKLIALALTMLAAFSLFAFVACGGGDDDDNTDTSPTAQATNDDNGGDDDDDDDEPTATEDSGDDDDDDGDDDDDDAGDVLADIQDLTGSLNTATGKVTYEVTDSDGSTSTMTFYSAPGKSRYDTVDGTDSSSYISNEDAGYVCTSSEMTCLQYPGGDGGIGLGFGFATFFSADYIAAYALAADAAGVDIERSSEEYAGIDAECFSWEEDDENGIGTGKMCFGGENNIMLYEEFVDASSTTKFEAIEVSEDVSDSDFEPPYPVFTIPSFPQ